MFLYRNKKREWSECSIHEILGNITRKDFKFIDDFCKKYNIRNGKGIHNLLAIFVMEYKEMKKCTKK